MIGHYIRKAIVCGSSLKLYRSITFANAVVNDFHKPKLCSTSSVVPEIVFDHVASDFLAIKKLWKERPADEMICPFLFQCFAKEKNSYTYALNMMCQTTYMSPVDNNSLAFSIMYLFQQWTLQNCVSEPLTEELKAEALRSVLRCKNRVFTQLVCDTYKITGDSELVRKVIDNLLAQGKHMQVCIAIIVLKMQREYPVEKIFLPIINRKTTGLLKMYVNDYPDLQMRLAYHLDKTLEKPQNSLNSCRVPSSFIRIFSSFVSHFKIPREKCPNLFECKNRSVLKFLVQKKYAENFFQDEDWENKIMGVVCDYPELQVKLIHKLIAINDTVTAKKIIEKFQVPSEKWPRVLLEDKTHSEVVSGNSYTSEQLQDPDGLEENEETDYSSEEEIEYLDLSLDKSKIKYITSVEEFENCLNDLTNNHHIVGIDSEWKPFGATRNRLALLQLAVPDKIYLVDIFHLDNYLKECHWDKLMDNLFGNPNILKLGCGLMSDVMVLLQGNKCTKGRKMKFSHLLDISIFFQKLLSVCPDLVPGFQENIHDLKDIKGLSKICHIVLGFPLNKCNQSSDWEVRPLTESQMMYGALDAYCLLQIYDRFKALALERELDFNKLLNISISMSVSLGNEHIRKKRKMKWLKQYQGFDVQPAIRIQDFKVLVDTNLQNLGKTLQLFGSDVAFLPDTIGDGMIEAAREEGRIILTCGSLLQQFEGCMNEGMYYIVPEHLKDDESIAARIFQEYNVKIDAGAIFSKQAANIKS